MSTRTIFSLAAVVVAFHFLPAQATRTIDSLKSIVDQEVPSYEQVNALSQLAVLNSGLDSMQCVSYAYQAVVLADELGYDAGRADALYALSRNALLKGAYPEASFLLDSLTHFAQQVGYLKGEGYALFGSAWLYYYQGQYERSILEHRKSLSIRRKINDRENLGSSFRGLGITYKLIGNLDSAVYYLNASLHQERLVSSQSGIAESLNHLGVVYGLRGNNPAALDAYYQALDIEKQINDQSGLAYTYQNIGHIHMQQEDLNKALQYFQQSLAIRQQIGEKRGVAQIKYNIGGIYHQQSSFGQALRFYLDALKIKQELGDRRGEADGLLALGRLFEDQEDNEQAIYYQSNSLKIAQSIQSDWGTVNALVALGRTHLKLGLTQEAHRYLIEARRLAEAAGLAESLSEALLLLASAERSLGHSGKAFDLLRQHMDLADSISNDVLTKRITLLEARYEFDQLTDSIQFVNERERLQLDNKIAQQRNLQVLTFLGIAVLILVVLAMYRYSRLKTRTNEKLSQLNQEISQKNEQLQRINDEKNNLISIVAHDLKSPLSAVIGSINLMQMDHWNEEDRQLREIIADASSRMQNMITEILNVEEIERGIDELIVKKLNVSEIVGEVVKQQAKTARKKQIEIQSSIDEDLLGLVDERFIYQIVENLLSNAIKFSPFEKQVVVSLHQDKDALVLQVQDQGPGLTSDDQEKLFRKFQRLSAKPTGDEQSTGLGLSIVKQFVDRMDGSIHVESHAGQGASFFVYLKAA